MHERLDPATRMWPLFAVAGGGTEPPEHDPAAGADAPSLRGRNILIVEDESLIALLMTDALEDAGATIVGPCYTLAECMRMARAEEIDAAVLDVDLAGQDVFPAADELRQRGIPFVFHTAHGDRDDLRTRFGDVPICRKPVRMDDLVASIARVASANPAN